jgi:hypothetical protein
MRITHVVLFLINLTTEAIFVEFEKSDIVLSWEISIHCTSSHPIFFYRIQGNVI